METLELSVQLLLLVSVWWNIDLFSSMIFDDGFDSSKKYLYAEYPHGV